MPRRNRGYYLRLDRRSGRWEIAWAEPGGRVRSRSTGQTDQRLAQEILDRFLDEETRPDAPERKTVREIATAYVAHQERKSAHWRQHRSADNNFARHFGWLAFNEVKKAHAGRYAERREGEGVSVGTIRQEVRMAHAMLAWWGKAHELAVPVFELPKPPPPRKRWLTEQEAERLMDACRAPHVRLFVLVALNTGARTGAILELTWDRVNLKHRVVDFGAGSGNKERAAVPINDELLAVLTDARGLASTPYVIEYAGGRVHDVERGFRGAVRRAGLADVHPHDLRRTAGSWMLQRKVPIEFVSAILGHRNTNITREVYAHLAVEHLREAVEAMGRGWKGKR